MDDSDDYGDLDESAFLEAATQAEHSASPRPPKRQKIAEQHETTGSIPPRNGNAQHNRRGPFVVDSDDESDFGTSPAVSRHAKTNDSRRTSAGSTKQNKRATSKEKDGEHGDEISRYMQKKKDRIHMPTTNLDLKDVFYTQPPRENSPPWKPRGAIWQKPALSIGVNRPSEPEPSLPQKWTGLDTMKTMALPGRNSISSRPTPRQSSVEQPRLPAKPIAPSRPHASNYEYDAAQELEDLPSDAFASSPQDDDVVVLSERRTVRTRLVAPQTDLRQTTLFGRETVNGEVRPSQANLRYNFVASQHEPPTHHKLDPEAIKTWVYPTNLGAPRDYQYNIVARGLFHNLLVALPTGLGKTFIAATIMLNWFRWTTDAQIIFVAPTKPLVAQQVEACFHTVGIPRSQTTMLTGEVLPAVRAEEWKDKRVFFMTPQTLINDLKAGYADPKRIVLLVVDEAHKATGAYAYTEVVSFLRRFNSSYRVLALTATPGSDVESVQKVIDNLDISRIEIRTENSLDIREYIFDRVVEKKTFTNSDEMEMCMELYSAAVLPLLKKLHGVKAFWSNDPLDLTPYGCMQASRKFMAEAARNGDPGRKAMVAALFTILGGLSQGMELLKYYGIGPFYMKMKQFKEEQVKGKSSNKKEICESEAFTKLMIRLQQWVNNDDFVGHPKLEYVQQVILEHFLNEGEGTRIMVFAHFRDSAEEIVRVLKKHQPMIRPRVFVGQSNSKNSEGMNQKAQFQAIEDFKKGTFNVLIATSIGEEGLDIGEVDLIICFDSKASPIRMLQRMGRTGRKRKGKIILLQMEGKEERDSVAAKDGYEKMQELIAKGTSFTFHEDRRIIPREVQPEVEQKFIEIPMENSQADLLPLPRKNARGRAPKRPPKKFNMPDGVITGFVTANRMDQEVAPKPRGRKKAAAAPGEEIYVASPLEAVLLDEESTKDLSKRYQTVFNEDEDEDGLIVPPLRYEGHPARQREFSRSRLSLFSKPGRVAKRFIETNRRMHAMDYERLAEFQRNVRHMDSDSDSELEEASVVVNDISGGGAAAYTIDDDMWASDDPGSPQPLPKTKSKAAPKPKPAPKAKAAPKEKAAPKPRAKPGPKPKAQTVPKVPSPVRTLTLPSRPLSQNAADAFTTTPVRQPKAKQRNYRVSDLAGEGASSSPPPTDPQFRLATQGVDIGSDDTEREDIDDTQAYLLDSDLRDFIAEDEEDVHLSDSSLPSLDFGLGRGTQAVVKEARKKKPRMVEKLFTSDVTVDDPLLSSDSDDDAPLAKTGASNKMAYVVDSDTAEDEEPMGPPLKRKRRVIEDDDDDE